MTAEISQVRKDYPFFEGISDDEIKEIQKIENTELVKEVASNILARKWDDVMKRCSTIADGHRYILASHLKGVTDLQAATGMIFLHTFKGYPQKIEPKESTYAIAVHPNDRDDKIIKGLFLPDEWVEFDAMDSPVLAIKPIAGLSTRLGMIRRLKEFQSDVGILNPDQVVIVHGKPLTAALFVQHDMQHLNLRKEVIYEMGKDSFLLHLNFAEMCEINLEKLPVYSKDLLLNYAQPRLPKDATDEDIVRYLIDETVGRIVDGFMESHISQLDREIAKELLYETSGRVSYYNVQDDAMSGDFIKEAHIEKALEILDFPNKKRRLN